MHSTVLGFFDFFRNGITKFHQFPSRKRPETVKISEFEGRFGEKFESYTEKQ